MCNDQFKFNSNVWVSTSGAQSGWELLMQTLHMGWVCSTPNISTVAHVIETFLERITIFVLLSIDIKWSFLSSSTERLQFIAVTRAIEK